MNHIERLSQEVELTQLQEGEKIRNLTQEEKKLSGLQERARWLKYAWNMLMWYVYNYYRNASKLLHTDLSDFQAAYLMEQQLDWIYISLHIIIFSIVSMQQSFTTEFHRLTMVV